jgi:hypothetical protein
MTLAIVSPTYTNSNFAQGQPTCKAPIAQILINYGLPKTRRCIEALNPKNNNRI